MKNKKIKVIKKKDLSVEKEREVTRPPAASEGAKTIVSNVSSWVNDFQKRKRLETKKAFETLLNNHPESVSS